MSCSAFKVETIGSQSTTAIPFFTLEVVNELYSCFINAKSGRKMATITSIKEACRLYTI
jgi:hypothetical protein